MCIFEGRPIANESQGVPERAGTDVPQHTWHSSALSLHISLSMNVFRCRWCTYLHGKSIVAVEGVRFDLCANVPAALHVLFI